MVYQDEYEDLLAPENFSMVESGVYRSAFPRSKNIPFLRSLGLRSVVALIPEDYPVHMTGYLFFRYSVCNYLIPIRSSSVPIIYYQPLRLLLITYVMIMIIADYQ